jgi:3-oxoacyl-[acyl-carrier protein] reductase
MLNGRAAVVTGASRGIGRAIALELARRGARVVVNFHQNAEAASQVVETIRREGGEAVSFQADVALLPQAEALIQTAVKSFGQVDILVNNAGITRDSLLLSMSEADWDTVLDTNLKSTFNCSRAALKPMIRRRYGRIINVSSVSGQMGNPGQANYSASKAGQIGFTKSLAREVASRGITVNCVAPGYIATAMTDNLPEDVKKAFLEIIPMKKFGLPSDVASAVKFLLSDEASYITGQVINVNGGMYM